MAVMDKMLDFDTKMLSYVGMEIPDHTQEALEHYLLRGYEPGGFLTSMLAGDLYRAISVADTVNRQMMWAIGRWIINNAPRGSWGSYDSVSAWCDDADGRRTAYATEVERTHIVRVLSTP